MARRVRLRELFRFFGSVIRSLYAWIRADFDETGSSQRHTWDQELSRAHMVFAVYYWILLGFSALFGFLASVKGIAIPMVFMTLGLALLVFHIAGYLFVALLVLFPVAIVDNPLDLRTALRASGILFVLSFALGPVVALFLASGGHGALVADRSDLPVQPTLDLSESQGDGCTDLCWQVLAGSGIETVRKGDALVYQRAPTEICRAFDPGFPAKLPCMVAARRQTDGAELRSEMTTVEFEQRPNPQRRGPDISGDRENRLVSWLRRFFYQPIKRTTLTISIAGSPVWKGQSTDYLAGTFWPVYNSDDNSSFGYRAFRWPMTSGNADLVSALTDMGYQIAKAPSQEIYSTAFARREFYSVRPQDIIIVASAFQLGFHPDDPNIAADIRRYMRQVKDREITELDRFILGKLRGNERFGGATGYREALERARLPENPVDL